MKNIEIEHRARFGEGKYIEIQKWLGEKVENGEVKDIGEDNRETHFFVCNDKFLKVANCTSKGAAKVCLKMNKIGHGAEAEEIEVGINTEDVLAMTRIFQETVGFETYMRSDQKRHNYLYRDVEIALKHSENWGHHLELEVMIDDLAKQQEAEKLIAEVAIELGVQIMTDQELLDFAKVLEAKRPYK